MVRLSAVGGKLLEHLFLVQKAIVIYFFLQHKTNLVYIALSCLFYSADRQQRGNWFWCPLSLNFEMSKAHESEKGEQNS